MNIKRIQDIMNQKNMSIYRLSKITGLSQGSLSMMMNGKLKKITIQTAIKIANALDVSLDEIVDRNI